MDSILAYSALAATGFACSTISFKLFDWYRQKYEAKVEARTNAEIIRDQRKPNADEWNTVLFFPDPLYPVGVKFTTTNNVFPEIPESPTYKFLQKFQAAKVSICICIQLASFSPLERILTEKSQAGLIILIITDHDTTDAHNNFLITQMQKRVERKRIKAEIRKRNTGYLMHNKFALIDDEALLTGSANWTQQGFRGNFEDILITTNRKIVKQYVKEFARLWGESEDFTLTNTS